MITKKIESLCFLNPQLDSLGSGYQIIQSKIAIGSGGLFGKGYLLGSQSRLNYLPEKHTDFIFTLISEEMGFLGSILIIFIFCVLITSIMRISFLVDSLFSKIIVFGIGCLIFLYLTLNIGMVCGLLPVVGAPLPLISHGGTSLITVLIGVGLVLSINIHNKSIRSFIEFIFLKKGQKCLGFLQLEMVIVGLDRISCYFVIIMGPSKN